MTLTCLDRFEYDARDLMHDHAPRLRHPLKRFVFDQLCPPDRPAQGRLHYARYAASPLPSVAALWPCAITVEPDIYDYAAATGTVWHVNFADPQLFVAYGSPLLAQDELQVLEHPALGCLREALLARRSDALTEQHGAATPVLIKHVERYCAFDTAPAFEPGRERGLYGNRFAAASRDAITSALRVFEQRTSTNLIAIAAPTGRGRYTLAQIEHILTTALTSFAAARAESAAGDVEIRTGFWGCGAFGGNRPLMALLQLLAARLAGIDRLKFYTFDQAGTIPFSDGQRALDVVLRDHSDGESLSAVLARIHARGYEWGTSDGT